MKTFTKNEVLDPKTGETQYENILTIAFQFSSTKLYFTSDYGTQCSEVWVTVHS